ncbi:hypothetical protein ACIQ7D_27520 [Streptomyces sp. NPDC096310]|uniref:hypothetical protein n=1 Tax=Streptomyces sp. NPDC096310 TaxID=3366082 RepID=UPI00382A6D90
MDFMEFVKCCLFSVTPYLQPQQIECVVVEVFGVGVQVLRDLETGASVPSQAEEVLVVGALDSEVPGAQQHAEVG